MAESAVDIRPAIKVNDSVSNIPSGLKSSFSFKHGGRKVTTFNTTMTVIAAPVESSNISSQITKIAPKVTITEEQMKEPVSHRQSVINRLAQSKQTTTAKNSSRKHTLYTNEEIDNVRQDDILKLSAIKKDSSSARKNEIQMVQKQIEDLFREYDNLRIINERKNNQLTVLRNKLMQFKNIADSNQENNQKSLDISRSLTSSYNNTMALYTIESRTMQMQQHVLKRLDNELNQIRTECAALQKVYENAKYELTGLTSTYNSKKLEFAQETKKLKKLMGSMTNHEIDREGKLIALQNIVNDGEKSIARIQSTSLDIEKAMKAVYGAGVTLVSPGQATLSMQNQKSPSRLNEKFVHADFESVEGSEGFITIQQIRELVSRYQSKESRQIRLTQQENELVNDITQEQDKLQGLKTAYNIINEKQLNLSSNRDVYRELELKENALLTCKRELADCRDKARQLHDNLECLRHAVPRFLAKLNCTSIDYSPDKTMEMIRCLEEEVLRLVKTIRASVMKETSPEDLAILAHQGTEAMTEIERIKKLPGFMKLQRQLFVNLMSADPDTTYRNLRIAVDPNHQDSDVETMNNRDDVSIHSRGRGSSVYQTGSIRSKSSAKGLRSSRASIDARFGNNNNNNDDIMELDRDTLKSISQFIVENSLKEDTKKKGQVEHNMLIHRM